jgi:hypothetical protein
VRPPHAAEPAPDAGNQANAQNGRLHRKKGWKETMSRERRLLLFQEEQLAEPGRFGCPMLVRAHCGHLRGRTDPLYRCSLGWALHGESDVMRCRVTDVVTDCWKVHPERLPTMTELEVVEVVDETEVRIAGD